MRFFTFLSLLTIAMANAKEKPKIEKSKDYLDVPICAILEGIQMAKVKASFCVGKTYKVSFKDSRPNSKADAKFLYAGKATNPGYGLFMFSMYRNGITRSFQIFASIDHKGIYTNKTPIDEGYYKMTGTASYRTVGGSMNTVFVFKKIQGLASPR